LPELLARQLQGDAEIAGSDWTDSNVQRAPREPPTTANGSVADEAVVSAIHGRNQKKKTETLTEAGPLMEVRRQARRELK
jgi:hypothetical protein